MSRVQIVLVSSRTPPVRPVVVHPRATLVMTIAVSIADPARPSAQCRPVQPSRFELQPGDSHASQKDRTYRPQKTPVTHSSFDSSGKSSSNGVAVGGRDPTHNPPALSKRSAAIRQAVHGIHVRSGDSVTTPQSTGGSLTPKLAQTPTTSINESPLLLHQTQTDGDAWLRRRVEEAVKVRIGATHAKFDAAVRL
jgi:hypothetical protein